MRPRCDEGARQRVTPKVTDLGLANIATDISYGDRITTTAIRSHLGDLKLGAR